jgi:hypothetical protein
MISFPTSVEPVERQFPHNRVLRQRRSTFLSVTGNQIQHAVWQHSGAQPRDVKEPERCIFAAFSTSVFPAASAIAIFNDPSTTGAFQGTMPPTTPIGSRRV